MSTAVVEREPIVADEAERGALDAIERALRPVADQQRAEIVGPDGTRTELPESLYAVLVRAAQELRRGRGVSILPVGMELTTQQAADLVNVSRPFLIRLLEAGQIPYHRVGTHRRIRLDDLLAYRRRRSEERREMLVGMAAEAQELGIYDE
jgi:excisionase family DNA binding protein